jgi:hypothetical protein
MYYYYDGSPLTIEMREAADRRERAARPSQGFTSSDGGYQTVLMEPYGALPRNLFASSEEYRRFRGVWLTYSG